MNNFKRGSNITVIMFLFSLIFFYRPLNSQAGTYYVDQNNSRASDSNPGSETLPWKTLKKACAVASAGDSIIVKPGVYIDSTSNERQAFNTANSGTSTYPITFISSVPRGAIIRSPSIGVNYDLIAWGISGRHYIIVDGFKIEGGFVFDGCTYSIIKNCELIYGRCPITDPSLNWGLTLYGSKYCTIRNNYIHNMADSGNHGHNSACIMVFQGSTDNIIENNLADAGGAIVYAGFGQKGGDIFRNTFRFNIAQNGAAAFLGMGSTDNTKESDDNIYFQNIVINCNSAFSLDHLCKRWHIYNNTAYNVTVFFAVYLDDNTNNELWNNIAFGGTTDVPHTRAISWAGYPDPISFSILLAYSDHNCFYNFPIIGFREKTPTLTYSNLSAWNSATGFDRNSTTSNPLFVNSSSNNFRLLANSPCINKGISSQNYERLTGSQNIGAYISGNEIIGPDWIMPGAPIDSLNPPKNLRRIQ